MLIYFIYVRLLAIFLAILSICGGGIYYLYSLNIKGVFLSIIFTIIIFFIFLKIIIHKELLILKNFNFKKNLNIPILFFLYLFLIISFYILFSNNTENSIISPWQIIPWHFFVFYFLTTILFLFVLEKQHNILTIICLILYLFLSFAIATIVYKIGYGYDPFIHEATINEINKNGFIIPKKLYYLGEYAIFIIFHKIFLIPISVLNKFFIPLISALFLPAFFLSEKSTPISRISSIILLVFPFFIFIITVPQNLAYLFLLLTILSIHKNNNSSFLYGMIFALASLFSHPIAGVPAILFVLANLTYHYKKNLYTIKKIFLSLIYLLMATILPFAFFLFQKGTYNFDLKNFNILSWPYIPTKENFILNIIYLYNFNIKFIFCLLTFFGILIIWHKNKLKYYFNNILSAIAMYISYGITSGFSFDYLADHEKSDYPNRMLIIASLFLIPIIIYLLKNITHKILNEKTLTKTLIFFIITIIITISLYISYPRFDNYFNSRGYSIGSSDIAVVHFIENNASNNYIVLANQQVSVAAVREFGFNNKYYNGHFYYPIPTSGPLYHYYLKMVYQKPDRNIMLEAMELMGVTEGYFVLNKYWWGFKKIFDEAKFSADEYHILEDGNIYVFKYKK